MVCNIRRWMLVAAVLAAGVTMSGAEAQGNSAAFGPSNPFYAQLAAIPGAAIRQDRDSDYQPAIEAGIAEQT